MKSPLLLKSRRCRRSTEFSANYAVHLCTIPTLQQVGLIGEWSGHLDSKPGPQQVPSGVGQSLPAPRRNFTDALVQQVGKLVLPAASGLDNQWKNTLAPGPAFATDATMASWPSPTAAPSPRCAAGPGRIRPTSAKLHIVASWSRTLGTTSATPMPKSPTPTQPAVLAEAPLRRHIGPSTQTRCPSQSMAPRWSWLRGLQVHRHIDQVAQRTGEHNYNSRRPRVPRSVGPASQATGPRWHAA